MRRFSLFLTAFLLAAAYVLGSAMELKPGKYQVKTRTALAGHDQGEDRGKTLCITSTDLEDPERIFNERFFLTHKADPTCTTKNLQNEHGKLSYDEDCDDRLIHVDATLFEGEYAAVRTVNPKSGAISVTFTMTGKRVGDCKE